MKKIELKKDDFISPITGVNISFFNLQSAVNDNLFNLRIGENISFISFEGSSVMHTHEFMEIIFILSGEIEHIVNSEVQMLQTGAVIFIRPNDIHCFQKIENKGAEIISVSLKLETFKSLGTYFEEPSIFKNFSREVAPTFINLSLEEIDNIGISLLKLNSLQFSNPNLVKVKFKVILADLFVKCFLTKSQLNNKNIPEWLESLCEKMKIEKNLQAGLKQFNKLAPCSQEHLCKVFKLYLNQTPTEFINKLKIEHSAQQLINSNAEIYAIAVDLGFKSLSRYYKLFKKQYGVPPAQYRKIMKKRKEGLIFH